MARQVQVDARGEVLRALAGGGDIDDVRISLAKRGSLSPRRGAEPFLGDLLDLTIEAFELCGASPDLPISMRDLEETYLAEFEFRGKVDHRNLEYALRYPALIHSGITPDLDGDLYSWRSELWPYTLYAILAYLRIAAERSGRSVADLAGELLERGRNDTQGPP